MRYGWIALILVGCGPGTLLGGPARHVALGETECEFTRVDDSWKLAVAVPAEFSGGDGDIVGVIVNSCEGPNGSFGFHSNELTCEGWTEVLGPVGCQRQGDDEEHGSFRFDLIANDVADGEYGCALTVHMMDADHHPLPHDGANSTTVETGSFTCASP